MYIFQRLIEIHLNPIFKTLAIENVEPGYYATPWFIALFTSKLNIDSSVKVFDLLFIEGYVAIFKLGLSIVKMKQEEIMDNSFEQILLVLNSSLSGLDKTELFSTYSQFKITKKDIEKINEEFHRNPNPLLITM